MTIRAFLVEQKENPKGKCPIKIVVTIKGKRTYHSTKIRIPAKDWNGKEVKKTAPNAAMINGIIRNKIAEIEAVALDIELKGDQLTVSKVSRRISRKPMDDDFYKYADNLISHLKKKFSEATMENYDSTMKRLKSYQAQIFFSDVDNTWLRKFHSSLLDDGLANNTIHKIWKILKKIFNSAISDGIIDNYPFKNYDNPKYKQTDRTWLTLQEVDKLEEAMKKPLPEALEIAGYYFLFGCYCGLRYSDWRRFTPEGFIQGDMLITRAQKNGELVSLQIHPRLQKIIDKITELPPVNSEGNTNESLKALAKIAGITKTITTHVARHSFAVRCAELGIPKETTADLMGITEKTCSIYYKVTDRKRNDEMKKWNQLSLPDAVDKATDKA
jgi:site-specific recombinase XerD